MNFINSAVALCITLGLCLNTSVVLAADLHDQMEKNSDVIEAEIVKLRHYFHQNPELSNREFKTAERIAKYLQELGLDVETGVAHTGVVAILKGGKPGPVVALRADMDALPVTEQTGLPFASTLRTTYAGKDVGVMHACGHDAHVAILLGAAKLLTAIRKDIPGTVKFIFQPAEEGAPQGEEGGAELMIKEAVLSGQYKPEAIFGLHNWPLKTGKIAYRTKGALAAADTFRIEVTGKQTHGSSPWMGVDPIVTAAQIISAIQTIPSRQLDITNSPAVITVGTINGGVRENIIPEIVELTGTIRTFDKGVREELIKRLTLVATSIAQSVGAVATVSIRPGTPVTYNDESLTMAMLPTLKRIVGAENVQQSPVIMGTEDFAFYQQDIPGLFFMLGAGQDGIAEADMPSPHRPDYIVNDKALKIGMRAMSALALDYLVGSKNAEQE